MTTLSDRDSMLEINLTNHVKISPLFYSIETGERGFLNKKKSMNKHIGCLTLRQHIVITFCNSKGYPEFGVDIYSIEQSLL